MAQFVYEIKAKLQGLTEDEAEEFINEVLQEVREHHLFESEAIQLKTMKKTSNQKFNEDSYGVIKV